MFGFTIWAAFGSRPGIKSRTDSLPGRLALYDYRWLTPLHVLLHPAVDSSAPLQIEDTPRVATIKAYTMLHEGDVGNADLFMQQAINLTLQK